MMKSFRNAKISVMVIICSLLFTSMMEGCGILPQIDTDSANRTKRASIESSTVDDDSSEREKTESSETEEVLDIFEQLRRDMEEMKAAFYRYFEETYDQYILLEDADLSEVVDLSSEAGIRMEQELEDAIIDRKAEISTGNAEIPERCHYQLSILATISQTEDMDGNKYGGILFDLMPAEERNKENYEDYLKRYPSFFHFGVNQLFLHKVDGRWKVFDTVCIQWIRNPWLSAINKMNVIRDYYDAAWEQYQQLEYIGLQEVIDQEAKGIETAEKSIRKSIEIWKKEKVGNPVRLPYEIHFLQKSARPIDHMEDTQYDVVFFELIPTADYEEGMTEKEYLKQYPEFMKLGENCFLIRRTGEKEESPVIIEEMDPEVRVYEEAIP